MNIKQIEAPQYESTYVDRVKIMGTFLVSPIGLMAIRIFFFFVSSKGIFYMFLKVLMVPLFTPLAVLAIIFEPFFLLLYGKSNALIYFVQQE